MTKVLLPLPLVLPVERTPLPRYVLFLLKDRVRDVDFEPPWVRLLVYLPVLPPVLERVVPPDFTYGLLFRVPAPELFACDTPRQASVNPTVSRHIFQIFMVLFEG